MDVCCRAARLTREQSDDLCGNETVETTMHEFVARILIERGSMRFCFGVVNAKPFYACFLLREGTDFPSSFDGAFGALKSALTTFLAAGAKSDPSPTVTTFFWST